MRISLLFLLGCLSFFIVVDSYASSTISKEQLAADKEAFETAPDDSFRFVGNALVCKMSSPDDDYACFVTGRFKIGETFIPPSEPWKEISQGDGVTVSVHLIVANDEHQAYWVIGHKEGKILSVQLTGNYPDENLSFSSIKLTDSKSKVREILGPRYVERNVESINGIMWDYNPFKITVEFVEDRVYSIRIAD